ncbi:cytochrome P450 [Paraburkholderia sp. JPY419]|uniref:cytochrome P450 n=1 Tax=Paraburkholderia sp. JPY419 TaxID=667660 RepID=UPI003D236B76
MTNTMHARQQTFQEPVTAPLGRGDRPLPDETSEEAPALDILGLSEADPYPQYAWLRDTSAVSQGPNGVWLVTRHADCMDVLRDTNGHFLTHAPCGDNFVIGRDAVHRQCGDDHARMRAALAPLFSRAAFEALRPAIERNAKALVHAFTSAEGCDIAKVALLLSVRTISEIIGIPADQVHMWLNACVPVAKLMSNVEIDATEHDRLRKEANDYAELVRRFIDNIDQKGATVHPVSPLLALEREGALSRNELIDNLAFLFVAGFVTTARSICNTVAGVALTRQLWDECVRDRTAIEWTVKELLRHDPAAHGAVRYASRDLDFHGKRIRRGEQIVLLLGSANRDPLVFDSPDRLDIRRKGAASLGFGAGMHACVGRAIATLEVQAVLAAVIDSLPRAVVDEKRSRRQQNGIVHGYVALWLHESSHG